MVLAVILHFTVIITIIIIIITSQINLPPLNLDCQIQYEHSRSTLHRLTNSINVSILYFRQ